MKATLTSLFPIEQMTAAEHEREDAKREGVEIKGSVMPLEVIKGEDGKATGLKMCECVMKGNTPEPVEGTEFVLEADIIIAAIGQVGDWEGIEGIANERGFVDVESGYKVKGKDKHFAGGDIIKPHLLTTAIGHGRVVAETIADFLDDGEIEKRPKIDIASFNLLEELHQRGHDPAPFEHPGELRGTSASDFAVHNYEDRSDGQIIKHTELFKGHFPYVPREVREEVHIEGDAVLGNFEERIIAYSEEQAKKEGERCMSCGMCFECDNCVIYCPQDAVHRVRKNDRAVGRYVETDYTRCIGCHICADVCPTGYIDMAMGE
jgi:Pyruvate/2-oxoacid:ferredoxin oxidoreductase delta subunit